MPDPDLLIEAARAVVDGTERACTVAVTDGRISGLDAAAAAGPGTEVLRLGADTALLPGLVDTHVHVNEPGRTHWEGFEHATRAAAAGGVTTIVDMPLNSLPPTVDEDALTAKRAAAEGRCHVDVGFWGGAVPGNAAALPGLWRAGAFGFKCFLADSGVAEFPPLDRPGLVAAMECIASFGGLLLVHAEDPARIGSVDGSGYDAFLASRPDRAEVDAVAAVVAGAERTGCRTHVVHVSSADTLAELAAARDRGVPVSAETCPHYLTLAAEQVPSGATEFKCCPPVRGRANQDLLWAGLASGTIGCVVTDHSPSPPELKATGSGSFAEAWGGIASLQLGLPVVWTEARRRGHDLADVARWMASGPADLVGLGRKGRIAVGADADLCVLAPDEPFVVRPERLHHRHPLTPYAGRELTGVVRETWLAGRRVDVAGPGRGRLLHRGES
ncbi:MAG TPA: allantoinase AllB [Nocardioidaceae bacterium]|nr:allantoinase AllB [Nocardioidaceae bacterium]